MRHITRACALLALAGCSSAPDPTRVPAALLPYADAARFLLPGFDSFACYSLPLEPEPGGTPAAAPGLVRVVRCGSEFEAPHGVGYGRYRGVEVYDFGTGGLDADEAIGEKITIGGVPVTHVRDERHPEYVVEAWVARVDGRYLVASHQRELLEQALQRAGRLDELLRPFAVPSLTEDVDSLVLLLPRAGDATYWGRPVPIEPMAASMSAKNRLRLYHRLPLPEEFTAWGGYATGPPVTTASADGWQVTTIDLEPTLRMLALEMLFGLAIFI